MFDQPIQEAPNPLAGRLQGPGASPADQGGQPQQPKLSSGDRGALAYLSSVAEQLEAAADESDKFAPMIEQVSAILSQGIQSIMNPQQSTPEGASGPPGPQVAPGMAQEEPSAGQLAPDGPENLPLY